MRSIDHSKGARHFTTTTGPCDDRPDVLIVNRQGSTHARIADVLRLVDYQVITSDSFYQAKHLMLLHPRLLIVDVRLGEFNGLHLAWYRRFIAPGPTIVTSPQPDGVLEEDARRANALWFLLPVDRQKLLEAVVRILGASPIFASRVTLPAHSMEVQRV